jgi:hypothetical protein
LLVCARRFVRSSYRKKILEAIKPAQIDIAVKAFEELEQRSHALDNQWRMKIERADYEAQLAQRRYEEVDPSNRLVASTLEKRWNDALTMLDEIRVQYTEYQKKNALIAAAHQKDKIQALAKELPHLWKSPSTNAKDRKRILRLLIKDITVEKINDGSVRKAILHIRWQGGAIEDLEIALPKKPQDKWRHSDVLVEQVKQLATTMTDEEIVNTFNQEGLKTNKGNKFTINSIQWVRFKNKIPSPRLNKPGELSINQVAEKFNVSHYVVRYWIERGIINARSIGKRLWIFLDADKETELRKRIENSTKIAIVKSKSQN